VVSGEEAPKDFLLLGVGLSYHPNVSDEIFVRYDGAWADDIQANAISGSRHSSEGGSDNGNERSAR